MKYTAAMTTALPPVQANRVWSDTKNKTPNITVYVREKPRMVAKGITYVYIYIYVYLDLDKHI